WSYHYRTYQPPNGCILPVTEYNYIVSIVSDTLLPNGRRYFKFSDGNLERIDSSTMNVYRWSGTDNLYDSLLARINDSYRTYRYNLVQVTVCDTLLINFGGQLRRSKGMCTVGGGYRLMSGIGNYGS